MFSRMNLRRWIAAGATVLVIGGGTGLALAQGGGPSGSTASAGAADLPEPGDVPDVAEAPDHADTPGQEASDAAAERAEAARLAPTAKVSRADAQAAALADTPGTVVEAQLGNEDGTVVWEIGVKAADGTGHEVKVNAATGAVLSSHADELD